jgi:DNA-binding NtrC family response regulator
VDVRVIAATNRDLEQAVRDGVFREDLYFRLDVVTISLPPLRERREEIPVLTDYFLKKYSVQYNKSVTSISPELARAFDHSDWPGNVRQLENLIKRLVVLGSEATIMKELQPSPAPLPFRPVGTSATVHAAAVPVVKPTSTEAGVVSKAASEVARLPAPPAAAAAMPGSCSLKDIARMAAREAERELILRMLTRTRWNRKEAAENLGISYKALLYKIKENGLDKAS